MIKEIIILLMITLFFIGFFGVWSYNNYKYEVEECCYGYRKYVLDGAVGGTCQYWSYLGHLKGIKGCAVFDSDKQRSVK